MALNDVTFIKGKGGLGRPLAGEDHYSGMVFYCASLPSGFTTTARIKQFFSLQDAVDAGIAKGSSNFGVMYYHIAEFFRINPKGVLFFGIFAVPSGAYDFAEVSNVQNFSEGKCRQIGVFVTGTAFATSQVDSLQTQATNLTTLHKPCNIIYCPDITTGGGFASIGSLPDLSALTNPSVSVVVGEDGGNDGATLRASTTKTVGILGATLGAVSSASVNECIAWVDKFNLSSGELDVLAFGNGQLYKDVTATNDNAISTLNDKNYLFLKKHVDIAGSYFNDSWTAVARTSDYGTIENGRTIDKAIRNVRKNVLPALASPLTINEDGTLSEDTIGFFDSLASRPLEQMEKDGELSASDIIINPAQNVVSTSKLVIAGKLIPRGVARQIEFNIGFTTKL